MMADRGQLQLDAGSEPWWGNQFISHSHSLNFVSGRRRAWNAVKHAMDLTGLETNTNLSHEC
jgi:hypothetical protein